MLRGRLSIDSQLLLRNLKPYITKGGPGKTLNRKEGVARILRALRENQRTGIVLPYEDVLQKVSRGGSAEPMPWMSTMV